LLSSVGSIPFPYTALFRSTALATTYVSATQLTAPVSAALIAASGNAAVTVGLQGATSNAVNFPIGALTITSLSPNTATAGGPGLDRKSVVWGRAGVGVGGA